MTDKKLTPNDLLYAHFDREDALAQLLENLDGMRYGRTTPVICGQKYRMLSSGFGRGLLQVYTRGTGFETISELGDLADFLRGMYVELPQWLTYFGKRKN